MAKVKKDWAREAAERLVSDGRGRSYLSSSFLYEQEQRAIKRIAAALRRAYFKGIKAEQKFGDRYISK